MLFSIQPNHPLPIYHQVVHQIKSAVASGALGPGDRLPSQRDLARELVVNHLTVKKAYETLERQGIIRILRGRGTYVTEDIPETLRDERRHAIRRQIEMLVGEARLLNMTRRDLLAEVAQSWSAARKSQKKSPMRETQHARR
jgi:GntR family transcriptional regulator